MLGVASSERQPALLDEILEAVCVQLAWPDLEGVTVRTGLNDLLLRLASSASRLRLECLPQARDMNLNVLHGAGRRLLSPYGIDQPVDRDHFVRVQ
jgi:hypothetical protein